MRIAGGFLLWPQHRGGHSGAGGVAEAGEAGKVWRVGVQAYMYVPALDGEEGVSGPGAVEVV